MRRVSIELKYLEKGLLRTCEVHEEKGYNLDVSDYAEETLLTEFEWVAKQVFDKDFSATINISASANGHGGMIQLMSIFKFNAKKDSYAVEILYQGYKRIDTIYLLTLNDLIVIMKYIAEDNDGTNYIKWMEQFIDYLNKNMMKGQGKIEF